MCKIHAFCCKIGFVAIYALLLQISFVAISALLCGEKITQNCVCREKMTNIKYDGDYISFVLNRERQKACLCEEVLGNLSHSGH